MDPKRRAVFLDIDKCLLSSTGNVCAQYYQSLAKISELVRRVDIRAFPNIYLCSGRDRNSVELIANLLGIVNTWTIIEAGAALFNPSTREIKLNPAITLKTKKLFKWIARKKLPRFLKSFKGLQVYPGYLVCHSFEKVAGSSIDIDVVYHDVRKTLAELIRKKLVKINRYFNRSVNIVPAGVSKGTAVKFLAQLEGIDLSYSLAIGDSRQDFSLLRRTGLVGCPNNADEQCKRLVRGKRGRVSHYDYSQGVVDIIDEYFPSGK